MRSAGAGCLRPTTTHRLHVPQAFRSVSPVVCVKLCNKVEVMGLSTEPTKLFDSLDLDSYRGLLTVRATGLLGIRVLGDGRQHRPSFDVRSEHS